GGEQERAQKRGSEATHALLLLRRPRRVRRFWSVAMSPLEVAVPPARSRNRRVFRWLERGTGIAEGPLTTGGGSHDFIEDSSCSPPPRARSRPCRCHRCLLVEQAGTLTLVRIAGA